MPWRADGFWIYDGQAPAGAFVWQIDLADESAAARVVTPLQARLETSVVRQSGARVIIAKATDGRPVDWAFVAR